MIVAQETHRSRAQLQSSSYVWIILLTPTLTLTRTPCEHVHCNTRFRSFPVRYGGPLVSRIVYFTWELLLPVFLRPFPCVILSETYEKPHVYSKVWVK